MQTTHSTITPAEPFNRYEYVPLVRADFTTPAVRVIVDEWNAIARRPSCIAHANAWGLPGEPVTHLDQMLVRMGFDRPAHCDEADQYLAQVVRLARTDDLAARLAVQRVVPPILAIAKRRGRIHPGGVEEALNAVMAQVWLVIRTYPSDNRPRKIAANIVRDVEYKEFVVPQRKRRTTVEHFDPEILDGFLQDMTREPNSIHSGCDGSSDALTELEARNLDPEKLALLKLVAAGYTSKEIGEILRIRARTVRWQRAEALSFARSALSTENFKAIRIYEEKQRQRLNGDATSHDATANYSSPQKHLNMP
jgi:DNA-directed RNA polymerase specialized sigma24 family protein